MGAASCSSNCCSSDDQPGGSDGAPAPAPPTSADHLGIEEELVVSKPAATRPSLVDQLQGKWVRQQDGFVMGVISGSKITWADGFTQKDSTRIEETGQNQVCMRLAGDVHEGKVVVARDGGIRPTRIHWSDGEVWYLDS
eukprot:TRINITY_DN44213_c0_g1_i1.p1 TRINITY_DN44213_c0_g1~~TRINITY_DN44213_c0_g1_i1.p1  ORF type:complete len:139 (-),score=33.72 TRINITY_DN44213_c0_g1_i1:110-526(-)